MTVYEFTANDIEGNEQSLGDYQDQVLLIVNTASRCGFTPQYEGLQALYDRYKERGFAVLGFPCNQFAHQEPDDAEAIQSFCQSRYDVSFPLFEKVNVNGGEAHPLYQYLKESAPGLLGSGLIKWNFTKFLVGRDGQVVKRYGSKVKPDALTADIEALL